MLNRQKEWENFCESIADLSFKKITSIIDDIVEFFITHYYFNSKYEITEEDIQKVINKYFVNIETQVLSFIIDKLKNEKELFKISPEEIKKAVNKMKEDPAKWGYEKITNTDCSETIN